MDNSLDLITSEEEELIIGEMEAEENEASNSIYPLNRDDVQVNVTQWTIFSIIEYMKRNKISLQPNFQRSYVWTDYQAEKLIDSVRNNLPIPQLFLLQNNEGELLVIDGQQRLTTLLRFVCNESEIRSIMKDDRVNKLQVSRKIFNHRDPVDKISFNDLSAAEQTSFENQALSFTNIKIAVQISDKAEKIAREIFHRLNTGGTKLTSQEIRLSIYNNSFTNEIKNISQEYRRQKLFPLGHSKFKNSPSLFSEILLRCLALLESFGSFAGKIECPYSKPYADFFDHYADLTKGFVNGIDISPAGRIRIEALSRAIDILGSMPDVFKHEIGSANGKPIVKTFNIKYIDTLLVGLVNHILDRGLSNINVDEILSKITTFKTDLAVYNDIINKTGDSDEKYTKERVERGISIFS